MEGKVKGILLREETVEAMLALSDEQRGKLILALFSDSGICDAPELDQATRIAFLLIAPSVRRAQGEASRRYTTNTENGKRGGRPKKQSDGFSDETEKTDGFSDETEKTDGFSDETEKTDGFSDETEKTKTKLKPNQIKPNQVKFNKERESKPTACQREAGASPARTPPQEERQRRTPSSARSPRPAQVPPVSRNPPTPEEVQAYCNERGNGISGDRFCDYYAAQGWRLSNGQPLKDWKAAVRNWETRNKDSPQQEAVRMPQNNSAPGWWEMNEAERREAHNREVCRQVAADLDAVGSAF